MSKAMYVVIFIILAFYLRKFQNQRIYIMVISCILPFVGLLVMSLLPNTTGNKWIKWGMFDMTVVFSLALFLGWSFSKNFPLLFDCTGSKPCLQSPQM